MATNVRLTLLNGSNVDVDAELVDPGTSDVASMTNSELLAAGVTKGTKIAQTGLEIVYVQESVQLVNTILQAALALGPNDSPVMIGGAVSRDGMPAATQVFNAAGPAEITGLALTGLVAGSYLFMLSGTASSSDIAACGATFVIAKNGVGIGSTLVSPQDTFGANNQASRGLGQMGLQLQDQAVPGDTYTVLVGVVPGGVVGDDITVTDVTLTAIRLS